MASHPTFVAHIDESGDEGFSNALSGGAHTTQAKIENNELVIRIPLEEPKPSSSGKTLIVASMGGNVQTDVEVNGKPVFVGLNAYIKK